MLRTFSASVACAFLAGCTVSPAPDGTPIAVAGTAATPTTVHRQPPGGTAPRTVALSGLASWYGPHHQGRRTASGARFDMRERTAAHPALPMGTRLQVSDPASGRSVLVTVNDRGPHVPGRIIDLSWRAAHDLGITDAGIVMVRLDVLPPVSVAPATRTRAKKAPPARPDGETAVPLLMAEQKAPD
ncbi:rare lipoprotein A (peptidoglycan hydrolase) [Azospirillum fermentarium]|uniref:septal ring lytic transglycosylase RlpA family protein n=1 Tax=Azospirillum fermentarium TaxID=1233114 RepID=UPI0022260715|nr:septal ring lytic transglycosylase RlpA family protein [Azospirillum fermentarium]MCW2248466.1 rare lipoprotein A (peptidoglycan hydrolase) [Azospirillum fermentarium]